MTSARDIRLLLSDVDGTLVTRDKVLTPAAIQAVRSLQAADVGFTVTSSRPPFGLRMLVEPLRLELPIGGCNGGLLVQPDYKVIEANLIDAATARTVVAFLRGMDLDVWLYTATEWFVPAATAAHVEREAWILKSEPVVAARFPADVLARAVKIVGVSEDLGGVGEAEAHAQAMFGDRVSATRSAHYFLDVTSPRASKGDVVEMLARTLALSPDQIGTIGDMPNDVLMFRRSGFSIAMGNASDEVKAQATAVTLSNDEDGFAHAVNTFILAGRAQ